jgi:hypothetical protein
LLVVEEDGQMVLAEQAAVVTREVAMTRWQTLAALERMVSAVAEVAATAVVLVA